ncbi:MAG: pyridoxamine 5'-phosphate oxidase family protein [Senegalimassilia sp.]|nr:pyridoxamine 5'-phosphate oxidase family protein [Senegalimassilia sp.]
MRQAGRQLRSTTQLHAVVEACQTVRIACVDEEGPFIVPMSFGYDWADPEEIDADAPRLALWVHSAGVGRKVDAFNREPRVAIEMDVQDGLITGTYACAYSYAYRSIMGTGTIHRIQGIEAKRYGLTRIMQHLAPEASTDFTDQALARANIYCIDVDRFTGKQRA